MVLAIPPTWSSASKTIARRPRLASSYAAVRPAGPAPRTSTGSPVATCGASAWSGTVEVIGSLGAPSSVGAQSEYPSCPCRTRISTARVAEDDRTGSCEGRRWALRRLACAEECGARQRAVEARPALAVAERLLDPVEAAEPAAEVVDHVHE